MINNGTPADIAFEFIWLCERILNLKAADFGFKEIRLVLMEEYDE